MALALGLDYRAAMLLRMRTVDEMAKQRADAMKKGR